MTKPATGIYHVRASGLTVPGIPATPTGTATGRVLRRGEEFEVTPELYAETLDRNGESWLDLTPEQQVTRWGQQRFGAGPTPEGIVIGDDDEGYLYRLGVAAREQALAVSDPGDRALALKAVYRDYGAALNPTQPAQIYPARNGF
ncbi:hypothetical protein [Microbacterium allomyrinae]|uniref:Uncharacterized protein n=1 Tax=Microbacterium allomyrinae TaxID=2830666 RepID=A0A9X1LTZ0_9MICO|nr:hypothetical protein [Microbacterium allomyrinae]MCC2031944.1 hypothetical protein [Microbacterium allomyrinae]